MGKGIDTLLDQAIYLRSAGLSYAQIANRLGVSKDAIQKRVQKALRSHNAPVPPPPEITLSQHNILILNDLHANFVDWQTLECAIRFAADNKITCCAIVGDLINSDSLSRFPTTYKRESMEKELAQARDVIAAIGEKMKEIYWCRGNHDFRVSISTGGGMDMSELARIIHPGTKGVTLHVTPYDRIWNNIRTGTWLLTHPHQYSRNPLVVARQLSAKFGCHVLVAHQHHHAIGASLDGKHVVADLPCACTPMPYKMMSTSTMPEWAPGFSALVKGRLVMRSLSLPYSL